MNNLSDLSNAELLHTTRVHLQRSHALDAELLILLGEIEARRLYLDRAYPKMFDFCVGEFGFSEDVTYNRLEVARLVRRLPRVLDFIRDGRLHLTGARLLGDVLTEENVEQVLAAAAGKSRRRIEELVASLAPKPAVPASIRKLPERVAPPPVQEEQPLSLPLAVGAPVVAASPLIEEMPSTPAPAPVARRAEVKPLNAEEFVVKFTASRALKDKLEKAKELMRHGEDGRDLASIVEAAVDVLIEQVQKERFGVGRKPRSTVEEAEAREVHTRHIPAAIERAVVERDGSQCTYVSPDGRRCQERGGLEFEHLEGFARTGRHTVEGITLHCHAHNQHKADLLYGREFMEEKRGGFRPGTESQAKLL
jgi:hypothetical protein